ncbi:CshA/CshB family fibrillar adhesin-related protein [Bifidobacterium sp. ESL0732]|uniref:CshA/CshB family fibrillar adhesin-related protein n=1 Tax=Bifidobacterium sp. ESL0732 TaxID=2983222 RepID=UPI0023F969A0|nr:CshA/CshB family fibrillar adhesin-related protein [Bifidobacterium sp. ESL0732]WEV64048.1 CshA/CshB family fibrillar adhesin-related protein [Bifidobacterium sp. ESL0732]
MVKHKGLARLAGVVGTIAMGLTGMLVTGTANAASPASHPAIGPQISATSGDGRFSEAINWVQWDQNSDVNISGKKVHWGKATNAGDGHWLITRCEIDPTGDSNTLSSDNMMTTYKPGEWYGDGLINLYNRKNSNDENTLTIGLANEEDGARVSFDYSCTAFLITSQNRPEYGESYERPAAGTYQEVGLEGMVFADAESNNWTGSAGQQEYIKVTPTAEDQKTPDWRLIDSYRTTGCTTNSVAELKADQTMRFRSDGEQCADSNYSFSGPSSVMFLQNSEKARVEIKGGGKTAIALGVVAATDFGDAPGRVPGSQPGDAGYDADHNYQVASSLVQPQWKGGELGTDIVSAGASTEPDDPDPSMAGAQVFNLTQARTDKKFADMDEPLPRLGVHEDPESRSHLSPNADWDDLNGDKDGGTMLNDEDGLAEAPKNETTGNVKILPDPSGDFTQIVSCAADGDAEVRGWIDWNHNGVFDENTEASNQVKCLDSGPNGSGGIKQGTATLKWTIPDDAKRGVAVSTTSRANQSFERLRITGEKSPLDNENHGIIELKATGITTTDGEVEDYPVDVYIPTIHVLMNLPEGRRDSTDQFDMTIKDANGNQVDSATTSGTNDGIQTNQIGPRSVGPNHEYTLSASLANGSASQESGYKTELQCLDLSKTPNAAVPVENGKIKMPGAYDADVQCTYVKTKLANPTLKITTHVNGGTATPANFPVTATPITGGNETSMGDGDAVSLNEGSYKIATDMSGQTGYEVTSPLSCVVPGTPSTPVSVDDATVALANGQNVECEQTVTPKAAKMKLETVVKNGNAKPEDFDFTVAPTSGSNETVSQGGIVTTPTGGIASVTGSDKANYTQVSFDYYNDDTDPGHTNPLTLAQAQAAMANGHNVTGVRVVQGAPAKLTLKTEMQDGSAVPNGMDFTVKPANGTGIPVTNGGNTGDIPGGAKYTVTGAALPDGYEDVGEIVYTDDATGNRLTPEQAQIALDAGQHVTGVRTIAQKPTLTVHLDTDYKYGGTAAGSSSKITIKPVGGSSQDVTLDQSKQVSSGRYSVEEALNAGYKLESIKVYTTDADGSNPQPVTLNPDGTFYVAPGSHVRVDLKNVDVPGTLEWSRYDGDGKTLLSGSEWELTGPNGEKIEVQDCTALECTGADKDPTPGKFKVTGLKWGKWTVAETKAPAGHELTKPVTLTIDPSANNGDGSGLVRSNVFQNGKTASGPELSATGADVIAVVAVALITLMAGMALATGTRKALHRYE